MRFSVLMTTYKKELPDNLKKSLWSILINQTVKPDQMVLVFDGPVSDELKKVANEMKKVFENEMIIVQLKENLGQAGASRIGLEYCTNELLARMDSDDISEVDRFEKELKIFNEHKDIDVVGGWIGEFFHDERIISRIRKVPRMNMEISQMLRFRNAVNNVTVMMKKECILHAGGYGNKSVNEDYSLYVQMMIDGAKFYNIQEVLVKVRTGNGMVRRRKDINIFFDWKRDQKKLLKARRTNFLFYIISNLGCLIFVMMPYQIKEIIYNYILRKRNY